MALIVEQLALHLKVTGSDNQVLVLFTFVCHYFCPHCY